MKKYFLPLLFPFLLNACKDSSEAQKAEAETVSKESKRIEGLQWLLGTWANQQGNTYSQETWSKENDSTFTGYSFVEVNKKEVVFAETMALEQKGTDLLLTVATANQKDKKPVTFKRVVSEKGQFAFENKTHDFPQRIVYAQPATDSLHAWIEGNVAGEFRKVDFHFSRKPE